MQRRIPVLCAAALAAAPLVPAAAAPLFFDNFDATTASAYNVNMSSADNRVTFGYNYAADGIPSAPHTVGGTTIGVKMEANLTAGQVAGLTISPKGQSFSGNYRLQFDAWQNSNGPMPDGGTGSTEYLSAGVGYNDTTVNLNTRSGSGTWAATSSEGGAGVGTSARDFMIMNNSGNQVLAENAAGVYAAGNDSSAQDNFNSYYATNFPGMSPPAAQQAAAPTVQTGTTNDGTLTYRWVTWTMDVSGNTVTWSLEDPANHLGPLVVATLPNAQSTAGNIALGYQDVFTSVNGNPQFSFGLVDNVSVTATPEPASLGLLASVGVLPLLRRRRRRRA
jgi:hypothetical protein